MDSAPILILIAIAALYIFNKKGIRVYLDDWMNR